MNRILVPLALASAVLLAGCEISVRPAPFDPPTMPRDATVSDSDPIESRVELAPDEVAWYAVRVSESVANAGELLYVEADVGANELANESGAVEVRVYRSDGAVRATSRSNSGFGVGESPAPLAPAALEGQEIDVARTCLDACVILPNAQGEVLVRVRNTSSTTRDVAVYAYAFEAQDTGEDDNDAVSTAPSLSGVDTGAIETLGDEDIYQVAGDGTLEFRSESPLALRADVVIGDRTVTTLEPGDTFDDIRSGDHVVVYSSGGYAGPPSSAGSSYTVEIR